MSVTTRTGASTRVPATPAWDDTLTQPIDMAALLAEQEPFDA